MILKKSKNYNPNYLARIVDIEEFVPHPSADRLKMAIVQYQSVIVDINSDPGLYVYFPLEVKINAKFLSFTNAFRDKTKNADNTLSGFFEDNCRVRAVKLRNEKSMGYLIPLHTLESFANVELSEFVDDEFDTVSDILLVEKYVIRQSQPGLKSNKKQFKKVSRLIDNQFKFHEDTENLRKHIGKLNPNDDISLTYKIHGTSGIIANILTKRNLNLFEKLLVKLGIRISDKKYDLIYSSRKVIKNDDINKDGAGFYSEDIWGKAVSDIGHLIPKGYTLYFEIAGYLSSGAGIQSMHGHVFDYGNNMNEYTIYIYRITFTNEDGITHELSTTDISEFCNRFGLTMVPILYVGKASNKYSLKIDDNWNSNFIKELEIEYLEKMCFMCKNPLPGEGIVLRIESGFKFEAYKLKSFKFLEGETQMLDLGISNIEDEN